MGSLMVNILKPTKVMLNKINSRSLEYLRINSELCKTNETGDTASLHKEAGETASFRTKIQTL